MTIKYNRSNTNFQILHFIAGNCHTVDGAYIALLNQRNERKRAIDALPILELKCKITRIEAERLCASTDPVDQLNGEVKLLELELELEYQKELVDGAKEELAFIEECMERLEPFREYGYMSNTQAAEACQEREWLLELKRRAENFLLTTGTIPHDHFNAMRQHPGFTKELLPHIERIHSGLGAGSNVTQMLDQDKLNLPEMLGFAEREEVAKQLHNERNVKY